MSLKDKLSKVKELPKKLKKKPIIWHREEEWQRAYSRLVASEEAYFSYDGSDEAKSEKLRANWEFDRKLFDALDSKREEWLDKTNTRPRKKEKDKLSKDSKLAAVITTVGIAAPPIIENYGGIIMRHAKDWVQKPRLWKR